MTRFPAVLRFALLLAGFSLLTALFFWPVVAHPGAQLLGPPEDNYQDFWNSWYAARGHLSNSGGAFFFTRLIFYPEGASLTYHSFAYPQIALVWALSKIFGTALPTLIALQNFTILLSFPLAGLSGFYLCRHLTGSSVGALAGGFIFAFNPAHVAQAMHHAHVAGIEFLPAFVLCYLIGLERRSWAWLAGAAGFYALSALSCWYYLFYGFYFLCFHLLYLRVHHHKYPRGWGLLAPAGVTAATALLLSPLIIPMLAAGTQTNAYQPGGNIFVADMLAWTAFPPTHLLAGWSASLYRRFTGDAWEATAYLGLANAALLALGFWLSRERRVLWYAIGSMIFFAVLASGDALHWAGQTLPVHMPGIVLSQLPFFANVRTPARAVVFVYLFLGVGVAGAIAALKMQRQIWTRAAVTVLAFLMLLDFAPARIATAPLACAPELNVLARDSSTFGVLDLPSGYVEINSYMAAQACHGRPIAQGIIARKLDASLIDHLEKEDFARQLQQLKDAGVKYILLHKPKDGLYAWTGYDGSETAWRRNYRAVTDGPAMTVLQVY